MARRALSKIEVYGIVDVDNKTGEIFVVEAALDDLVKDLSKELSRRRNREDLILTMAFDRTEFPSRLIVKLERGRLCKENEVAHADFKRIGCPSLIQDAGGIKYVKMSVFLNLIKTEFLREYVKYVIEVMTTYRDAMETAYQLIKALMWFSHMGYPNKIDLKLHDSGCEYSQSNFIMHIYGS